MRCSTALRTAAMSKSHNAACRFAGTSPVTVAPDTVAPVASVTTPETELQAPLWANAETSMHTSSAAHSAPMLNKVRASCTSTPKGNDLDMPKTEFSKLKERQRQARQGEQRRWQEAANRWRTQNLWTITL